MGESYRSPRITEQHHVGAVSSGEPSLDTWLRSAALIADGSGTARTFVWIDDAEIVVAYLSLCPHEIRREGLPPKLRRGGPNVIPAILLARLALDRRLHRARRIASR